MTHLGFCPFSSDHPSAHPWPFEPPFASRSWGGLRGGRDCTSTNVAAADFFAAAVLGAPRGYGGAWGYGAGLLAMVVACLEVVSFTVVAFLGVSLLGRRLNDIQKGRGLAPTREKREYLDLGLGYFGCHCSQVLLLWALCGEGLGNLRRRFRGSAIAAVAAGFASCLCPY